MSDDDADDELSPHVEQLLERARRFVGRASGPNPDRTNAQKLAILLKTNDTYTLRMNATGEAIQQATLALAGQMDGDETTTKLLLEDQPDLLLSTLSKHLTALGGRMYLQIDFGDDWGVIELALW
jgi:hypothetical protein